MLQFNKYQMRNGKKMTVRGEKKICSMLLCFDIISKYRSILMGIGIIGIMVFHYTEDCRVNGFLTPLENWYYTFIRSSFVDVFLFLSGFGLYYSMKKSSDIAQFYSRRFTKILIPYIIIALPAWIFRDIIIEGNEAGILGGVLKDFFFVSFFTEGKLWFWYILMILVCYCIFPYVFKIFENAKDHIEEHMYMMNVFCFFSVVALALQANQSEFYSNIRIALIRVPVFSFGCMIGKAAYEKRKIPIYVWLCTLLSPFVVQLAKSGRIMIIYYVCAFFCLSLCLWILVALNCISKYFGKICSLIKIILGWFGKYSLELYLSHVALRTVFKALGYPTHRKKCTLFMWCLSIVIALIVKKLTMVLQNFMARAASRDRKLTY